MGRVFRVGLFCFSKTPLNLNQEDFQMLRPVENSPKQVIQLSVMCVKRIQSKNRILEKENIRGLLSGCALWDVG